MLYFRSEIRREKGENMYCPKCGSQIPDEAVFCPKCGTQVKTAGHTPQQSYVPPQAYTTPQPGTAPQSFVQPQVYVPQQTVQTQPAITSRKRGGGLKKLLALVVIAAVLYAAGPYIKDVLEKYLGKFRGEPVTQDGGGDERAEAWKSIFQELFGKDNETQEESGTPGQPGGTVQPPSGDTGPVPGNDPSGTAQSGNEQSGTATPGGEQSSPANPSSSSSASPSPGNTDTGNSSSAGTSQGNQSGSSSSGNDTSGNGTWQEDLMPQSIDDLTQVIFDDFLYPEVLLEQGAPQNAVGLDIYEASGAWKYELISEELDYREIGRTSILFGQDGLYFDLYPEFSVYGDDVYATNREEIGYPTLTGYVDEKVFRFSSGDPGMDAVLGMFFSVDGTQFGFGSITAANGNTVTVLLTRP